MGKPFTKEINDLPRSISWALTQDIEMLRRVLQGSSARQLSIIGSGGSFTAAAFLAHLRGASGSMAHAMTPLEYIARHNQQQPNKAVAFLSAEGKNKDILAAAQTTLNLVCPCFSLTLTTSNPLLGLCETTGLKTVIWRPTVCLP